MIYGLYLEYMLEAYLGCMVGECTKLVAKTVARGSTRMHTHRNTCTFLGTHMSS